MVLANPVYLWYLWQENYQEYGHVQCVHTQFWLTLLICVSGFVYLKGGARANPLPAKLYLFLILRTQSSCHDPSMQSLL